MNLKEIFKKYLSNLLSLFPQKNKKVEKRGVALKFLKFFLILAAFLSAGYIYLAFFLPLPDQLTQPQNLPTTKIYDRNGILLYEILNPDHGRKTYLKLEDFPSTFLQATLAAEDQRFYQHSGVDFPAIFRALLFNTFEQRIRSGASTITQQLVRNLLKHNRSRSLNEKLVEAAYAIRLSNAYTKDQILEKYLNTVYYGNLSYGAQTAALNFFGKNLSDLDLAEQTILAGLPQSPSNYNPLQNFALAKKRQKYVLDQMVKNGHITQKQADESAIEPLKFQKAKNILKAPHFVNYIINQLSEIYGEDAVNYGGLQVYTTLDYNLNLAAEKIIDQHLKTLENKNVTNSAALAVDIQTGEILVWIGSRDFFSDQIDGQVDIVNSMRQPGSALKPFLYLQAFEKLAYTPATIIPDIPFSYQTDTGLYTPQNYDLDFHGPVRVRTALANSYNIPAVRTLEKIGVSNFLGFLKKFGLNSLNRPAEYYGLSLTLGGGEVTLFEMVRAYKALADAGRYQNLFGILAVNSNPNPHLERSEDPDLSATEPTQSSWTPIQDPSTPAGPSLSPSPHPELVSGPSLSRPGKTQILGPRAAQNTWLISKILSDPNSRLESFGEGSALELPFEAAAKTGTTRNFNDNWTFGYSGQIVAGVWVGNNDSSPMENISGIDGAGPIWHDLMLALDSRPSPSAPPHPELVSGSSPSPSVPPHPELVSGSSPSPSAKSTTLSRIPPQVIELQICRLSGYLPTSLCPDLIFEWFDISNQPAQKDYWYQECGLTYPIEYHKWASDRDLLNNSCPPQSTLLPTPHLERSEDPDLSATEPTQSSWTPIQELPPHPELVSGSSSSSPVFILSPLEKDEFQLSSEIPLESQKVNIRYQINEPLNSLEIYIDSAPLPPTPHPELVSGSTSSTPTTSKSNLSPQTPSTLSKISPGIFNFSWIPIRGQHRLVIRATTTQNTVYSTPEISFTVN